VYQTRDLAVQVSRSRRYRVKRDAVSELPLESLEHLTTTLNAERFRVKLGDVNMKVGAGVPMSQEAKPVVIKWRLVRLVPLEERGDQVHFIRAPRCGGDEGSPDGYIQAREKPPW
jgi:hypothetical protein